MNSKLELNKYDKKTLELQKETFFIQNRAEKKITGLFREGYFLRIHLFEEKKKGQILHILITLLNLKQKSNNSKY